MKNIHVLPTDKPSEFYSIDGKHKLANSTMAMDWYISSAGYKPHNIYITNDEKIKEGDWYYYFGHIIKYEKDAHTLTPNCKKIILTTDPILIQSGVQAIPNDFLDWFVQNPSCERVKIDLQYQYHSSKEFYHDADYVNCTKEQYESIKNEIPTCPLRILYKIIIPKEELKQEFTTVNGSSGCTITVTDEKGNPLTYWGGLKEPKQETLEEAAEKLSKDAYKKHSLKDDTLSLDEQIQRSGGFIVGFKEGLKEGANFQKEQDKNKYSEQDIKSAYNEGAFAQLRYRDGKKWVDSNEWFENIKNKQQ